MPTDPMVSRLCPVCQQPMHHDEDTADTKYDGEVLLNNIWTCDRPRLPDGSSHAVMFTEQATDDQKAAFAKAAEDLESEHDDEDDEEQEDE